MASFFGVIKKMFGGGQSQAKQESIAETVENVAVDAAEKLNEVANSEVVQAAVGTTNDGEAPQLPPLAMKEPIDYLDRDHFVLPRSDLAKKAIALVDKTVGQDATARAIRIFEYGVAGGQAHELRVDREIVLLGALLGQLGPDSPAKAESFCVENGMWPALAQKVAFAINNNETGTTTNDIEARALALGVAAEVANGDVAYVHAATAAETRNRNVH